MIELYKSATLKGVLDGVYQSRHTKNANYSQRAFARDLNIAPSHLNDILKRGAGLSSKKAREVGKLLGMNDGDLNYFVSLVESEFGSSDMRRKNAKRQLGVMKVKTLPLDQFSPISKWYHFAILELLLVEPIQLDKFAGYLGLEKPICDEAIETLIAAKYISVADGRATLNNDMVEVGQEIPSPEIRQFHKDILVKASQAIEEQPIAKRDYSSNLVAIKLDRMAEAKTCIDEFIRGFVAEFGSGAGKDELFCFSTQFFSLRSATYEAR